MKHRKPNRIKASTSLSLAGAAAVVSLLGTPANAAPADPSVVPTAPGQQPGDGQPDGSQPTTEPAPENPQAVVVPGAKPENVQPGTTKPQRSQPGVTTPGSPQPGTTQPGTTQPGATVPSGESPKTDDTQPAGVAPKDSKPTQPGVTVPRVAPLPVPGQQAPAIPVQVPPAPSTTKPDTQANNPGTVQPAVTTDQDQPDTSLNTLTGEPSVQKPQWQAPAVETAPAAPVVEMTGPHTEIGANVDGGATLPGFAANTHHFSNLDGYVGTIGYTTPGGTGEAGMSLDFTQVNQIKVTAFASAGAGDDRKMEFILDTTVANAVKADTENFIRLMPGGATILDAAAQIGRLPAGDIPGQTTDLGGMTTQVGGSVQY
ncbi:hypothetical protein OHB26_05870 [Nocardia sp. NBC_01503]|uniref:hypothetical protein n=1 Tax=Nocardia sp. NBC_01503 TaxID=2975997 RepID=UPI002E7AF233|nr:hypothetical protein [Nocardia sp. NBC_01503]WTL33751.1 hypothetical protein OHB26_05870 [Nocardia sp. NBC_01503]